MNPDKSPNLCPSFNLNFDDTPEGKPTSASAAPRPRTARRALFSPSKRAPGIAALAIVAIIAGGSGCAAEREPAPGAGAMPGGTACAASPRELSPSPARPIRLEPGDGAGPAEARYWPAHGADCDTHNRPVAGIVFVSGVDGGFIEPADGIYSRIADRLAARGIPSVFVQYRAPGELEPSVNDALAAAAHLRAAGARKLAIVGWSFGGAVITHAASRLPEAATIVGFAPQAKDTEAVAAFRADQSILLFHSDADENVPFISSRQILDEAPPAARTKFFEIEGANHALDGEGERIAPVALGWLEAELGLPPAGP